MNVYQRALRDFQDYADDVSRSRYRTFADSMRRFTSTLVSTTPLGDVVGQLPPVDFDAWYAAQRATVGGMVGSGVLRWPDNGSERLSLQVELMRRMASGELDILNFTTDFMWAGNNINDNVAEFVQQVFRPFVRDFLRFAHDTISFENGLRQPDATLQLEAVMADDLTLFISHNARDAAIAKALIALFEKSLKISARKIRCTSVDGYRLPVGADTNDVLRAEVFGAKIFIALLTPNSLSSPYVLFELGARWGARRPLFPVLAGSATPTHLPAPLNTLNALSASVPDQVRQLVEDASAALSERLEPISSFSAEVDAVIAAAGPTS